MTTVHIMQASLKRLLTPGQKRAALEEVYSRGADVIGHTEAHSDHRLLGAATRAAGYTLIHPEAAGPYAHVSTAIALNNDSDLTLDDAYHIATTPGQPGKARLGGHEPRDLTIVELDVPGLGTLAVAEFHTVTGWGQPGRADGRDDTILEQWRTSTKIAARLGRGSDVAVLMGDVNYDPDDRSPETPSAILAAAGWTSALDEADRPDLPTHGNRTIDQLYTLDRDRRVSVDRVRRWTAPHLDHAQVSVWLNVAPRKAPRPW